MQGCGRVGVDWILAGTEIVALRRGLCIASVVCLLGARVVSDERSGGNGNFRDPQAVEEVLSGRNTVANAAWWGFDPVDSTTAIQGAINSGASKVVIPYTGQDWVVRPIFLASDQEVVFEPGVFVTAREGYFKGETDALFMGREVRNLKLRGYGAVARMRKADYLASKYRRSEWRHVLALHGASDVEVAGLVLQSSGGDGIYLGPTWDSRRIPCRNVRVLDCVCNDNLRQGISIVSGEHIRIENCALRNTQGTAPQAGIDVEPAKPNDLAVDIQIRNCVAIGNEGTGFFTNLSRLNASSQPVSLRFVDCVVRNSRQPGLRAVLREAADPSGIVEFANCAVEGTEYAGAMTVWNTAAAIQLRFVDCKWREVARRAAEAPIHLELHGRSNADGGGVTFSNCYVYDDRARNPVRVVSPSRLSEHRAVLGQIHLINSQIDITQGFGAEKLPELTVTHARQQ